MLHLEKTEVYKAMKYAHVNFEDTYTLSEQRYLMEAETDMASLMAQSNGYMGVRGSLEEYGTVGVQGGFYPGDHRRLPLCSHTGH